jgi:hypothetical protein
VWRDSKRTSERYQTSPAEDDVAIGSDEAVVSSPRLSNAYHSAIEFTAPYTQAILIVGASLVFANSLAMKKETGQRIRTLLECGRRRCVDDVLPR